jgi:hypothetical protein
VKTRWIPPPEKAADALVVIFLTMIAGTGQHQDGSGLRARPIANRLVLLTIDGPSDAWSPKK